MARLRHRRRPGTAATVAQQEGATSQDGYSAAALRHRLNTDPVFRILSVDGLNWIDPYTGILVQAPFDWQEGALRWLLANTPWNKHQPRSLERLQCHRWRVFLRTVISDEPKFRRFDKEGRWLNPYTGAWVDGVRREGKTITLDTLTDMATLLAATPEAQAGETLDSLKIECLVDAAKRSVNAAASGPAPVTNLPLAPANDGARMRITGRSGATASSSDEHATRRAIRPSDLVAGYRVISRIGTGGMSAVYRARQEAMGREVALKILQAHGERAEAFAERFILEAKAAGGISHPNVVTVYDFGRHAGKLFMTMELMAGGDVESELKQAHGPLRELRALQIIHDATAGLAALHEAKLIHRDVKPSNIFLGADGEAKIGDLGLAKQTNNESTITIDGAAVGTPAFMAPEQARGDSLIDHRVDIYGMGATLYMLLSGQPPYHGGNVFTVVRRVLSEPIPDIRLRNRAVSAATAKLIATATAKDAKGRFPDAATLLAAIEAAMAQCGDRPAEPVDVQEQTATIRHRLADHLSTESMLASDVGEGRVTDSKDHVALERQLDPTQQLLALGYHLGLFAACADNSDHHALRLLGRRPLLLLVHTAGIAPAQRAQVAQGLDAIIDDLVAAAPDSTGELFSRFHRHLRKAGLATLSAVGVILSEDGSQACISCADLQPPCLFGDPTHSIDLRQVGYRDEALGSHERSSRETWIEIPPGGGLTLISPGTLLAVDAEGTAFDLPHVAASLILNADLDAQDLAESLGEDVDHHAEGQLRHDATLIVLKRTR